MTTKYKENPVISTISEDFNPSNIDQLTRFQRAYSLKSQSVTRFNFNEISNCKLVTLIITTIFLCGSIVIVTIAGTSIILNLIIII
jgi:hypothetical protein